MSTYIIDREPKKYGGQQESYLKKTSSLVDDTVAMIRDGVKAEKDLTAVFLEILPILGQARHQIAKDHKTWGNNPL